MDNFVECSICASKPGAPDLCESCTTNRNVISKLEECLRQTARERDNLKEAVNCMYKALGLVFKAFRDG